MQNLVVVREVEIEFKPGLSVITGETGAGKSILIEALGLALGERADPRLVRPGAERAVVSASFELNAGSPAIEYLAGQALDDDKECILRRVINRDGRSRAFINGTPVALSVVKDLAALLVDIHAQHAGQRLLQRDVQRTLLDDFGANEKTRSALTEAFNDWRTCTEALHEFEREGADAARLELMRYQAEELAEARLSEAELETIEDQYKKLANAQFHREQCELVRGALNAAEGSAQHALDAALSAARTLLKQIPESKNLNSSLEQASVALDEAVAELDRIEAGLSADPHEVERLDRRLSELHKLSRKHQVALPELAQLAQDLEASLAAYDQRDERHQALQDAAQTSLEAYLAAAKTLRSSRSKAARRMNKDITARLNALGMPHAKFVVEMTSLPDDSPLPHGLDRVEFRVSTNPEQPPGAVNKVASGGELSRITLAIQAATAEHNGVPVAIYDEVDTGIGGNTANIVGQSLRDVAAHAQVVCITHSPQVASAGDHHILVDKQISDGQAETRLRALNSKAREQEIARMLGAQKTTGSGLAHARELLAGARS